MKPTRWMCAVTLVAALVVGCSKPEQQSQPTSKPKGKLKLAFVTNNAADFWTIARAGCEKAAAELPNVALEFRIPSDATAATQKRIVDDLLAKGIDGIAISPIDPVNQTLFLNEVAKQALLVTQDSDAPQSDRACYLGTDNVAAGRQAGELIKQALPQGGKIMIFVGKWRPRTPATVSTASRKSCRAPISRSLTLAPTTPTRCAPRTTSLDTIVNYPDVACLVGLWNYNGPAILNAVRDSGKVGKIKIVCFDEEEETLAGVKSRRDLRHRRPAAL